MERYSHQPPPFLATHGTLGQIAIFYTIRRYGPIVFTVIMTTRQVSLSLSLSLLSLSLFSLSLSHTHTHI